jgi:hypothetical protein
MSLLSSSTTAIIRSVIVKVDSKNKYFIKRINNIKYNKWKC